MFKVRSTVTQGVMKNIGVTVAGETSIRNGLFLNILEQIRNSYIFKIKWPNSEQKSKHGVGGLGQVSLSPNPTPIITFQRCH